MTACANNNEGKAFSGKKAVSATLAGVLAVGMVPAAALADEAPADGAEDADIDLLEVPATTAFANGEITAADNSGEKVVDSKTVKEIGKAPIKFAYDGSAHYVVPQSILPEGATVAEDLEDEDLYTVEYTAKGNSGTKLDPTKIVDPGTYTVTITGKMEAGTYSGATVSFDFTITPLKLENATVVLAENGKADAEETKITYKGEPYTFDATGDLGLAIDGVSLDYAIDYTVTKLYVKGGSASGKINPTAAGTYVAVIDPTNDALYGNGTYAVEFTIDKLNLADAVLGIDNKGSFGSNVVDNWNTSDFVPNYENVYLNGAATLGATDIAITYVSDDRGLGGFGNKGTYTVSIAPKDDDAKKNIEGSQNVTYVVVDDKAKVEYAGTVLDGTNYTKANPYTVNNASASTAFDPKLIEVTAGVKVDDKDLYSITYKKSDGSVATEADLKTPGMYQVVIDLNASEMTPAYSYGAHASMWIKVVGGTINPSKDVYFTLDGKVVDGTATVTYDGKNVLDRIAITIKDEDGNVLTEGTDYEVVVTKGGKKVDEIVDAANDYRIEIKSEAYVGLTDVLNVTVDPIKVAQVRVADTLKFGNREILSYTGSAITPTFEYTTKTDPKETDWVALPDVYDVDCYFAKELNIGPDGSDQTKYAPAKEMNEKGFYVLKLSTDSIAKGAGNYTITAGTQAINAARGASIEVTDAKVFADVPATHWASEYVYSATSAPLNYMNGYAGTAIFGPDKAITRAEAAIVLYNMAGGDAYQGGWDGKTFDFLGYKAEFNDVNGDEYFMAALSWATKVGVVTGYQDGSGNFGPNDSITREQFATMLVRYAEIVGDDTAVADQAAELAKYKDADQIDAYAQKAIAWLSQEGIMTGSKDPALTGYMLPDSNVTRAEVAKMAVEYQSEPIELI